MKLSLCLGSITYLLCLSVAGETGGVIMRADSLAQPKVSMRLGGELGRRIDVDISQWLIPAPMANPGLIEMFHLRDRQPPYPDPVPWAGEFAGKFLIGAVQALRQSDNAELRGTVQRLVEALKAAQAEDGYLGPFRQKDRLLGQWDLWGHYHVMLGLYTWYKDTGDAEALKTALRAAHLICNVYLDSGRKVLDAGSPEMNMSIIHVLGILYRETGNERYGALVRQIEKEFELPGAGDYFRQALSGVDFFRTPKPRWESLHAVQGLGELYRMTGDTRYRDALVNIWASISTLDIHNSGSFSTNEGAVGNPFKPGSIETCCTVAWTALCIDVLEFTRDSKVADRIELALYNAIMGYQHPSGRWSTYNTPMDGKREASAHTIVFQSRAGTPEFNCCSANAPRGLGMVSEWGVMTDQDQIYLNFYGPGRIQFTDAGGVAWQLEQATAYPADGAVKIMVQTSKPVEATLQLRNPAWSASTPLQVNDAEAVQAQGGAYHAIRRVWQTGDSVALVFDMKPRFLVGDANVKNRASVYLGPLLLAYDQQLNDFEPEQIPELDANAFTCAPIDAGRMYFKPMVAVRVTPPSGPPVNLCDFATAGSSGTYYQTWLPVKNLPPAYFELTRPRKDKRVPCAPITFRWTSAGPDAVYQLVVTATDSPNSPLVLDVSDIHGTEFTAERISRKDELLYWHVVAQNPKGSAVCANSPWPFTVDSLLKPAQDAVLIETPLDGAGAPKRGTLVSQTGVSAAEDRHATTNGALAFDGVAGKVMYGIDEFPSEEYTFMAWIKPAGLSGPEAGRLHHIASAWKAAMDEPLRLTIQNGKLKAIIEIGGGSIATPDLPIEENHWYFVAMVKDGPQLSLFVDGVLKGNVAVPETLDTAADALALGGNPYYTGQPEFFAGAMDSVTFLSRALSPEEIKAAFEKE